MKNEILKKLTPMELQILKLIAMGDGNKEIGKESHISIHTVKAHISSLIRKMNARNRTHAAYMAAIYNIINDDEDNE